METAGRAPANLARFFPRAREDPPRPPPAPRARPASRRAPSPAPTTPPAPPAPRERRRGSAPQGEHSSEKPRGAAERCAQGAGSDTEGASVAARRQEGRGTPAAASGSATDSPPGALAERARALVTARPKGSRARAVPFRGDNPAPPSLARGGSVPLWSRPPQPAQPIRGGGYARPEGPWAGPAPGSVPTWRQRASRCRPALFAVVNQAFRL
ncbi:atherin-like [Pseudopipra pipra]|uniref:atherin-like n=1 Tax=Pseudopipra pipra TaxID=415032 RepID=UPI003139F564